MEHPDKEPTAEKPTYATCLICDDTGVWCGKCSKNIRRYYELEHPECPDSDCGTKWLFLAKGRGTDSLADKLGYLHLQVIHKQTLEAEAHTIRRPEENHLGKRAVEKVYVLGRYL